MSTTKFKLNEEFIPLIRLLKYTGLAESGAMASEMVDSRIVLCNGVVETRKRYKVRKNDVIIVDDQTIIIQ